MESREHYRSLNDNGASTVQVDNEKQETNYNTPTYQFEEPEAACTERSDKFTKIGKWRRYLILIAVPIVLLPLPLAVPGTVRNFSRFLIVIVLHFKNTQIIVWFS